MGLRIDLQQVVDLDGLPSDIDSTIHDPRVGRIEKQFEVDFLILAPDELEKGESRPGIPISASCTLLVNEYFSGLNWTWI